MLLQRKQAIQAAQIERTELKREADEVRRKAKELKKTIVPAPVSAPAAAAATTAVPKAVPAPAAAPAPAPAAVAAPAAAPAAAAAPAGKAATTLTAPTGETVYIKGRDEAVKLMDMMMADDEFMRYQEELFADVEDSMVEEIYNAGRLRTQSFVGKAGMRDPDEVNEGELDSSSVSNRADMLSRMEHVRIHE